MTFPLLLSRYDTLNESGLPVFRFNPSLSSFTAKMALRGGLPSGLSGAGVYVVGKQDVSEGDSIRYARGSQINGTFYDVVDTNQGGFGFWLLPLWDGDDDQHHVFWMAEDYHLNIYKVADNTLRFRFCDSEHTSVDISGWTAGTWYRIEGRWDVDNEVNGSNYAELYIDTVLESFSTVTDTPAAVQGTQFFGVWDQYTRHANAIIADFYLSRRVPTTSEYTSMWNGGNGKLAGNVLPAEDLCFYVTASLSAGELVSGEGNACRWPWGDNELTNWHFQNATAGAPDDWTAVNAPTLADAATADILFDTRSQKVSVTGTNQGIRQDFACSPGDNFIVSLWVKDDGVERVYSYAWDVTGGALIVRSDNSTRSGNWELLQYAFEAPAGCNAARIYILSQAAASYDYHIAQCQVLPNIVDNGGMEGTYDDESGGGGGTVNVAPGWSAWQVETGGTDTLDKCTVASDPGGHGVDPHSGDGCQYIDVDGADEGIRTDPGAAFSPSKWHGVSLWLYGISGNVRIYDATKEYLDVTVTPPSEWTRYVFLCNMDSVGRRLYVVSVGGGAEFYVDDISSVVLDDISLTVVPATESESTENGGRRVDGRDTLTQPITKLTNDEGDIRFTNRPLIDAANAVGFGNSPAYIVELWGDASNYIRLYWNAANTITLAFNDGGGEHSDTWDATGEIDALTNYSFRITYTENSMKLIVDGDEKIEIVQPIDFATIPATAYWGSKQDGTLQSDIIVI